MMLSEQLRCRITVPLSKTAWLAKLTAEGRAVLFGINSRSLNKAACAKTAARYLISNSGTRCVRASKEPVTLAEQERHPVPVAEPNPLKVLPEMLLE